LEKRIKHKIVRTRCKHEEIERVDENTFFHRSSAVMENGEHDYYMVYHEHTNRDRWLCDCMSFVMNIVDSNSPTPNCKHIKAIKAKYDIT